MLRADADPAQKATCSDGRASKYPCTPAVGTAERNREISFAIECAPLQFPKRANFSFSSDGAHRIVRTRVQRQILIHEAVDSAQGFCCKIKNAVVKTANMEIKGTQRTARILVKCLILLALTYTQARVGEDPCSKRTLKH